MSIIYLPQLLVVVNSVGSNFAIGPSRKNYFIGEKRAFWIDSGDLSLGVDASGFDWIIVGVPKSNGSIIWTGDEFVWAAF